MPNGRSAQTSDMNEAAHGASLSAQDTESDEQVDDYLGPHVEKKGEERVIHRKVFSERVFRVRNVFTMNCGPLPAAAPISHHSCSAMNRTSLLTFLRFRLLFSLCSIRSSLIH